MHELNKFKMGYILVYQGDSSFISEAIEKRQIEAGISMKNACYTHCEISGGGLHSINIAPPRSKLVDITKAHAGRRVRVIRYKNDTYEKHGRYKVAYFSAALCANKGYDIAGVLGFLYKWMKQNNRLYFCSEGCLTALQKEFPAAMNYREPEYCMPGHFLDCKEFETVWEGLIKSNGVTELRLKFA